MGDLKDKIVHRSAQYSRTEVDDEQGRLEKAAADFWEKECERDGSRDSFPGVILVDAELIKRRMMMIPFRTPITQEQATTAATIFQWMFTNMGRSALEQVYREVGLRIRIVHPENFLQEVYLDEKKKEEIPRPPE